MKRTLPRFSPLLSVGIALLCMVWWIGGRFLRGAGAYASPHWIGAHWGVELEFGFDGATLHVGHGWPSAEFERQRDGQGNAYPSLGFNAVGLVLQRNVNVFYGVRPIEIRWWSFGIPWWFVVLLFATPRIRRLERKRLLTSLRRTRLARTHCRGCGYDLRASFDRCPECGLKRYRFSRYQQIPLRNERDPVHR